MVLATIQQTDQNILYWGRVPWLLPVLAGWVYCFVCVCYVQEHSKAQKVTVLLLKRPRRRGRALKSHPTDWE